MTRHNALVTFVNVVKPRGAGPYPCPCCGYLTLPERGGYDICPVCWWEDDGQDTHDADVIRGGPNQHLSLTEARANYAKLGAISATALGHVRQPLPSDIPK